MSPAAPTSNPVSRVLGVVGAVLAVLTGALTGTALGSDGETAVAGATLGGGVLLGFYRVIVVVGRLASDASAWLRADAENRRQLTDALAEGARAQESTTEMLREIRDLLRAPPHGDAP